MAIVRWGETCLSLQLHHSLVLFREVSTRRPLLLTLRHQPRSLRWKSDLPNLIEERAQGGREGEGEGGRDGGRGRGRERERTKKYAFIVV